ncbi:MAG TPA: hypothetical protein V6D07_17215 [Trichocoleus sp.]
MAGIHNISEEEDVSPQLQFVVFFHRAEKYFMENYDEHAREKLAHQRQQAEHLQEAMRLRSEEELHQTNPSNLDERARENLARQRQQSEHLHDTLLERSEEEVQ